MFKHRTIRKSNEDRVFRNPRNIIKSSKWESHRTWNVGIEQVLLANGRRHQPRNACIGSGMCAFGKRHRPIACNISRSMCASARHQRLWPVLIANDNRQRPRPATHQLWHVHIWQMTSAKWHAASAKSCTHQSWCAHIDWVTSIVACVYRLMAGDIGQDSTRSTAGAARSAGRHRRGSRKICQRHRQWRAIAKAFTLLTWYVHIGRLH
ncbi:hypothetical protein H5410_014748 [Solanum commersonii]|uniref:Uncharacterized protein n=1 Tax=Solanum commersonii TaxID=4109 RepID=A0A9J5ZSB8_SOLCO|nr:hypothetical protein H5410_014748 [Solanum commersonii]